MTDQSTIASAPTQNPSLTLGQFIETTMNKTYETWREMTPKEFFQSFWEINKHLINKETLVQFMNDLNYDSEDETDEGISIEELDKRTIKHWGEICHESEELDEIKDEEDYNLKMWNTPFDKFIQNIIDPSLEYKELYQLIKERLPEIKIPIKRERANNYTGYCRRLTESIPIDRYCWCTDKKGKIIFQINNVLYFQESDDPCILIRGEIKPGDQYDKSAFYYQCDPEHLIKIIKQRFPQSN
jgi:hypothetical protein